MLLSGAQRSAAVQIRVAGGWGQCLARGDGGFRVFWRGLALRLRALAARRVEERTPISCLAVRALLLARFRCLRADRVPSRVGVDADQRSGRGLLRQFETQFLRAMVVRVHWRIRHCSQIIRRTRDFAQPLVLVDRSYFFVTAAVLRPAACQVPPARVGVVPTSSFFRHLNPIMLRRPPPLSSLLPPIRVRPSTSPSSLSHLASTYEPFF